MSIRLKSLTIALTSSVVFASGASSAPEVYFRVGTGDSLNKGPDTVPEPDPDETDESVPTDPGDNGDGDSGDEDEDPGVDEPEVPEDEETPGGDSAGRMENVSGVYVSSSKVPIWGYCGNDDFLTPYHWDCDRDGTQNLVVGNQNDETSSSNVEDQDDEWQAVDYLSDAEAAGISWWSTEGATPSATIISDPQLVTGRQTERFAVSVEGNSLSIQACAAAAGCSDAGPWSRSVVVKGGDYIRLRTQTPAGFQASKSVEILAGGKFSRWTITTMRDPSAPREPEVVFAERYNANPDSFIISEPTVYSGPATDLPITSIYGSIQVCNQPAQCKPAGPWSTESVVRDGQFVMARYEDDYLDYGSSDYMVVYLGEEGHSSRFTVHAEEERDTDGDGTPDNVDIDPYSAGSSQRDSDGDGDPDTSDPDPKDPFQVPYEPTTLAHSYWRINFKRAVDVDPSTGYRFPVQEIQFYGPGNRQTSLIETVPGVPISSSPAMRAQIADGVWNARSSGGTAGDVHLLAGYTGWVGYHFDSPVRVGAWGVNHGRSEGILEENYHAVVDVEWSDDGTIWKRADRQASDLLPAYGGFVYDLN